MSNARCYRNLLIMPWTAVIRTPFKASIHFFLIIVGFVLGSPIGKNKRSDPRTGDHKKGSYKKKSGPKATSKGGKVSKVVASARAANKKSTWKKENAKFIAALALERGESMDGGGARMVLLATCQLIEEAGLPFGDDAESQQIMKLSKRGLLEQTRQVVVMKALCTAAFRKAHRRRNCRTRS